MRARESILVRMTTAVAAATCTLVVAGTARAQAMLENPALGSLQSGIAAISGWRCNATNVQVRFDGGAPIPASYGTTREDTVAVCGDSNNGFGLLFNYGLLADGAHMIEVLDAGTPFAEAVFSVTRFGTEFLTGASGSVRLHDFPAAGQDVTLIWQEALQAFTIAGRCGAPDAPPCPPSSSAAAFLWSDDPTPASTFAPDTNYQFNSAGGDGTVTRLSEGVYNVAFPNQGGSGEYRGVAQVTAYGTEARFCKLSTGWGPSTGGSMAITVYCFDTSGNPVDTQFSLIWTRPGEDSSPFAFVDTTDADPGFAIPLHQFNSSGAPGYVQGSAGNYLAFFPGHNEFGTVKVSSTSLGPNRCDVYALYADGETGFSRVDVRCVDAAGMPASAMFALSYAHDGSIAPGTSGGSAYVWANEPTNPSYTANASTQYLSSGGAATITRSGAGSYEVLLPGLSTSGGNVQVTAHGSIEPRICVVEGWDPAGSDEVIDVGCFDSAGAPADSTFLLNFVQ